MTMYSQFGLFINGASTSGTATGKVISPVTEKPLGTVPKATAEETRAALDAAARACPQTGTGTGGRLSGDAAPILADAGGGDAVHNGATIAHGGKRPTHLNSGFFFEPTVLTDVTDDMKVFARENFGPIAAIARSATEEEVTQRANASDMGLSAYAFTRSPDRARRMVAWLKAGMAGINSFALAASEAPFGGPNHSGMGREGGTEGIGDDLDTKLAQIVF